MPPSATAQVEAAYARRVPEETILYGVVREQLETFLAHAQANGRSDADPLATDEPLLAEICAASVRSRTAMGDSRMRRVFALDVLECGDLTFHEG